MAIHIVTDSTSCLPTGFAEQHDLPVVPLKVSVDGVFFREFAEISPDAFYAKQKAGAKSGTTQPGPEDFIAVYTLSLIHISEPTRLGMISYAVFCLNKKNQ